jgi:predicted transcriptional regulator YheO
VNLDTTDFMNAIRSVEEFVSTGNERGENHKETFASSVNETIDSLVEQIVEKIGKQPSTMSAAERLQFIGALEEKGAFLIKGAVDRVAIMTGVSKYTVYNYLQKIRARQAMETH